MANPGGVRGLFKGRVYGNAGWMDALLRHSELLYHLGRRLVGDDVEVQVVRDSYGMRYVIGQDHGGEYPRVLFLVVPQNSCAIEMRRHQDLSSRLFHETRKGFEAGSPGGAPGSLLLVTFPISRTVPGGPEFRDLGHPLVCVGGPASRGMLCCPELRDPVDPAVRRGHELQRFEICPAQQRLHTRRDFSRKVYRQALSLGL